MKLINVLNVLPNSRVGIPDQFYTKTENGACLSHYIHELINPTDKVMVLKIWKLKNGVKMIVTTKRLKRTLSTPQE